MGEIITDKFTFDIEREKGFIVMSHLLEEKVEPIDFLNEIENLQNSIDSKKKSIEKQQMTLDEMNKYKEFIEKLEEERKEEVTRFVEAVKSDTTEQETNER